MDELIVWNGMSAKQVSGGDNYTIKLIKYYQRKKDIILSKNSANIITGKDRLLKTEYGTPTNLFSLFGLYITRIFQSVLFLMKEKRKYNLAISSSPFLFDVIPAAISKSKRKAVFIFHIVPKRKAVNFSTSMRFFFANLEKSISYYLIRKFFDTIIVGNTDVKNNLKKYFSDKRILIADAGIDTKSIKKYRTNIKNKNLACFAGRLVTQKGILDLVDIMKDIEKTNPKLKLIILGDGPDKEKFLTKIKESDLSSIELKGFVSEEEKYKTINNAEYFFFPSYEEGWGIALAEALCLNAKAICYELPYYQDIFKKYPFYANIGDKKGFVKAFKRAEKSKVKDSQHKFIENYDDKNVIKKLIDQLNIND